MRRTVDLDQIESFLPKFNINQTSSTKLVVSEVPFLQGGALHFKAFYFFLIKRGKRVGSGIGVFFHPFSFNRGIISLTL
jgi:hypothetical protein